MALDILYDNGIPSGAPAVTAGAGGYLLEGLSIDSNTVNVTYEAGDTPTFTPSAGDIVLMYDPTDYTNFCVIYVTGSGPSPQIGEFPVNFVGDYDPNFYTFRPGSQDYIVVYSENLYSSLLESVANTYKVKAEITKAHYSDLMIAYSKNIKYDVTIDDIRRKFWNYSKDALYADTLFLIDRCESPAKAYKISADSNTFEIFNNKYKSSITFNVAV